MRSLEKYTKQKVININDWKSAKSYSEKLERFHQAKNLSHLDPVHAVYMDMQHHIADFIELFSNLPESRKLNQTFERAEAMYMPSGPPMSPITRSYFTCWTAFDMAVGIKRETYATIMHHFCTALGAHANFLQVLRCMQQSRMGLYIVENNDTSFVYLREIYTNKIVKTYVADSYLGLPGEIWLVRLLPDPTGSYCDYSVAFTTPYIIIDFPLGKSMPENFEELIYSEESWIQFIERNLQHSKHKDKEQAYNQFMKYGLTNLYWPEYIFQAYVNHKPNMILLTGFPDKPETLPHANDNYNQCLNEKKRNALKAGD